MMYFWIVLALFFLAVLETVSHHFERSVFSRIRNEFWNSFFKSDWKRKYVDIETLEKKKGLDYILSLIDAYHVSKWLMIFCFAMALGFDYVYVFAAAEYLMHRAFYTDLFIRDKS